MARYGRKASEKVKKAMRERKRGTLRSGRSGKKLRAESRRLPLDCQRPGAPAEKSRARRPRKNSSGDHPYGRLERRTQVRITFNVSYLAGQDSRSRTEAHGTSRLGRRSGWFKSESDAHSLWLIGRARSGF